MLAAFRGTSQAIHLDTTDKSHGAETQFNLDKSKHRQEPAKINM
jgi:hypothetical protein